MVQSFGQITVTTGGTPARASANLSAATVAKPVMVQSFLIQSAPENTGLIYVLSDEASAPGDLRTTRTKVLAILGAPPSALGPFYGTSYAMPAAPYGAVDLRHIWIDASVNGEKAIVSGAHSNDGRYS